MDRKKLLFIAPRFHTNQFSLTKNLIEAGVDVRFLVIYEGASENHKYLTPELSKPSKLIAWLIKNMNSKYPGDRRKLRKFHLTSFRQCFQLYRNYNPDIIIVRNLRPFSSIQHLIIGKVLGKKVYLYTLNNYRQRIGIWRSLFYKTLKSVNVKHYTPVQGSIHDPIIPNTLYIPMVMDSFIKKKDIIKRREKKGIYIMTIGKMTERKNLKELVESLVRTRFFDSPDNFLRIVSECITEQNFEYLNQVKDSIPANNSQINFHLNIAHADVFKLMKQSDLFVLPSHNEPAGTALVEAMACGLAVVCSDSNGTQWYIEPGKNGEIFKYSSNFKDLDIVLNNILHKETLVRYGLASLDRINRYHGISTFYNSIIQN